MPVDFSSLNCSGCPAIDELRKPGRVARIREVEHMRDQALQRMPGQSPLLILLCESIPGESFIYDVAAKSKLRDNLRREFMGEGTDQELFRFMDLHGIWVVDCALCPLHRLGSPKDRREAATVCLERNTIAHVRGIPGASLAAIFPRNCGFKKSQRELADIRGRVLRWFTFSDVRGLRDIVADPRST